ncbi:hypothetical protein H8959_007188 [Pygathrix nigripes]
MPGGMSLQQTGHQPSVCVVGVCGASTPGRSSSGAVVWQQLLHTMQLTLPPALLVSPYLCPVGSCDGTSGVAVACHRNKQWVLSVAVYTAHLAGSESSDTPLDAPGHPCMGAWCVISDGQAVFTLGETVVGASLQARTSVIPQISLRSLPVTQPPGDTALLAAVLYRAQLPLPGCCGIAPSLGASNSLCPSSPYDGSVPPGDSLQPAEWPTFERGSAADESRSLGPHSHVAKVGSTSCAYPPGGSLAPLQGAPWTELEGRTAASPGIACSSEAGPGLMHPGPVAALSTEAEQGRQGGKVPSTDPTMATPATGLVFLPTLTSHGQQPSCPSCGLDPCGVFQPTVVEKTQLREPGAGHGCLPGCPPHLQCPGSLCLGIPECPRSIPSGFQSDADRVQGSGLPMLLSAPPSPAR